MLALPREAPRRVLERVRLLRELQEPGLPRGAVHVGFTRYRAAPAAPPRYRAARPGLCRGSGSAHPTAPPLEQRLGSVALFDLCSLCGGPLGRGGC